MTKKIKQSVERVECRKSFDIASETLKTISSDIEYTSVAINTTCIKAFIAEKIDVGSFIGRESLNFFQHGKNRMQKVVIRH